MPAHTTGHNMQTGFHQLLYRIGITDEDVALLAGVTERAVRYWRAGMNPAPQSAILILRAFEDGLVTAEWLQAEIAKVSQLETAA